MRRIAFFAPGGPGAFRKDGKDDAARRCDGRISHGAFQGRLGTAARPAMDNLRQERHAALQVAKGGQIRRHGRERRVRE